MRWWRRQTETPPQPARPVLRVRQMMALIALIAVMLAGIVSGLKHWRVIQIGQVGGPVRSLSVMEFLNDPADDGMVRILVINNRDQTVRSVEVGPQAKFGRCGPIAPGQAGSLRIPVHPLGVAIPLAYTMAEPAGDVSYQIQIAASSHPLTDTQSLTLNADRTYTVGPGPHSLAR